MRVANEDRKPNRTLYYLLSSECSMFNRLRETIEYTVGRMASKGAPPQICGACGATGANLLRCSSCKEVCYCGAEHQKEDWKKHKVCCKAVAENPTCIFIEAAKGEGNGLLNRQKSHIFSNYREGMTYISQQFNGNVSPPLKSPFSELLGWRVEFYCNSSHQEISRGGSNSRTRLTGRHVEGLNSAGIYLGCDVQSGLSRYTNLDGKIFLTGRNAVGKTLTKDILWGILNFLCDSMDYYGDDDDPIPQILDQARQYRAQEWTPAGGDGGVNVYNANEPSAKNVVDHRK